jgi:N6-L-threonylcarbamoyladenine synthase
MKEKYSIKILAIETSCDETSAAVIGCANKTEETKNKGTKEQNRPVILSNIISSQVDLHAKTGGVVPEVASRAHIESIIPVIAEALIKANPNFKTLNSKLNQKSKSKIQNSLEIENLDLNIVPHLDGIPPEAAISDLGFSYSDLLKNITHISVTAGPGLIGSLLVGFNTAKALAYALDIPIVPVNHIEGHIYSALLNKNQKLKIKNRNCGENHYLNDQKTKPNKLSSSVFPLLALTVSGGHTSLTLMHNHGKYQNVGATIDDAAGEAFDKVAKLLDLGYPGGPIVSKLAQGYRTNNKSKIKNQNDGGDHCQSIGDINQHRSVEKVNSGCPNIKFPRPMLDKDNFDFSFSGLKTAVLYTVQKLTANSYQLSIADKQQICYEFEEAVVEVLVTKTMRAAEKYGVKNIVVAGGVSANKRLREVFVQELKDRGTQ